MGLLLTTKLDLGTLDPHDALTTSTALALAGCCLLCSCLAGFRFLRFLCSCSLCLARLSLAGHFRPAVGFSLFPFCCSCSGSVCCGLS
jgi:hypothetical protein